MEYKEEEIKDLKSPITPHATVYLLIRKKPGPSFTS